ncbi:MAG TPA: MotA/TolQ/ExbB proton channel family protein [Rhodospirillaceae bacterium]|nr:MotA/TolQ/ExbB proton channel family protein [Rhodospirillaceae bacterium]
MTRFIRIAALGAVLLAAGAATPVTAANITEPSAPVASATNPAAETTPVIATQQVDNPYGLDALWTQGDFVARGTLATLVIMSVATWYILIAKLIEQWRLLAHARSANRSFWKAASLHEGLKTVDEKSAFFYLANSGIEAVANHDGTLVEQIDLNNWVTLSIQRATDDIVNRLQGGLAVVATIGSTAPFVGLFGTVWGIYHALTAIGIAGQASIDKVAGPVGEALIMTAIGLAVAVPAVLGYNLLVRRNKVATEKVRGFAGNLHSVLLSGGRLASLPLARATVARVA